MSRIRTLSRAIRKRRRDYLCGIAAASRRPASRSKSLFISRASAPISKPALRSSNEELLEGAGLGFEIAFDPNALPALFTWRKLDFGDYVMSVEPANTAAIQGREYALSASHAAVSRSRAGPRLRSDVHRTFARGASGKH